MKPLPINYSKNGYNFSLISRNGDIATYSQADPDSGRIVAYEVFQVKKNKERTIAGKLIPPSESTPSNEEWGTLGFTVHTIQEAAVKEAILSQREENRKNRVALTQ